VQRANRLPARGVPLARFDQLERLGLAASLGGVREAGVHERSVIARRVPDRLREQCRSGGELARVDAHARAQHHGKHGQRSHFARVRNRAAGQLVYFDLLAGRRERRG
jgi:hypothetical protein